jgi:hypothetical protein
MLVLLALSAVAVPAEGCAPVTLDQVVQGPTPRVVVLGEQPGDPVDLRRATRAVRALRDRGPVLLGLEAVHQDQDRALQALRAPLPDLDAVADRVDWAEHWRGDPAAYRPLLALGLTDVPGGVELIAVGTDPVGPRDADVDVPAGEPERLARLAGEQLPYTLRRPLARARAWSDDRLARTALGAWDGEGVLVLVVDQTRVAGRGGLAWHLRQRTEAEVVPVVLSWSDLACTDGTLVWSPPVLRASLPGWALPEPVELASPLDRDDEG